jgi:hypothetical protein
MIRTVTSEPGPRCRVERTDKRQRDTRPDKDNGIDTAYHDHVGRGPKRGDPPPAAPLGIRQPTLLQHQRLHELSHRRHVERNRSLRHLRLDPPRSLRDGIRPRPDLRPGSCAAAHVRRGPSNSLPAAPRRPLRRGLERPAFISAPDRSVGGHQEHPLLQVGTPCVPGGGRAVH